jgi:lipid A 4'-phosphatase
MRIVHSFPGGRRLTPDKISMGRSGLIVVLFVAAIAGLVLGLFPQIDLWVARAFYVATNTDQAVASRTFLAASIVRKVARSVEILLAAAPVIALIIKLILPRSKMIIPMSAVVFLLSTLALGPGLLVNVALKDHTGRPRPGRIVQFGGNEHFVAWWDLDGDCPRNCSFVSGEVSTAFWTMAPAALAPPAWRPLSYAAALTFGVAMSIVRMATGGHFLSDAIFAGVLTYVVIWLVYGLTYRWRRTLFDDDAIESALERVCVRWQTALTRRSRRSTDQAAGPNNGDG